MRHFRLTDRSLKAFFEPSKEYKVSEIQQLFTQYPGQRFILVGDSGEHDPEVYAEVYRRWPAQVVGIAIRLAGNEKMRKKARFEAAFKNVPVGQWLTFREGSDWKSRVSEWKRMGIQDPSPRHN
ncbi:hypothetical protein BVY04_01255 [bacterium M21]|nr:hypothetical protein BVY04_01255 [bacterium M21]